MASLSVPAGTYPHGTNAKYVLEKCRCPDCTAASSAKERRRSKLRAMGRSAQVSSEAAREHVAYLMSCGMGYKRIGKAAGLNPRTIYVLMAGRSDRNTAPPKRIYRTTEAKILAVRPSVVPRQTMNALPVWDMVADLMALGYSKAWIAEQLGHQHALQLGKRYCEAKNALAIRELWQTTTVPREANSRHEQAAITRAQNFSKTLRNRIAARRAHVPKPRTGRGTRIPNRITKTYGQVS